MQPIFWWCFAVSFQQTNELSRSPKQESMETLTAVHDSLGLICQFFALEDLFVAPAHLRQKTPTHSLSLNYLTWLKLFVSVTSNKKRFFCNEAFFSGLVDEDCSFWKAFWKNEAGSHDGPIPFQNFSYVLVDVKRFIINLRPLLLCF